MPSFIQGHALIIGVGSYQHELRLNVPITAADARALATVLHDPQYCGYPAAQVRLLSDSNASRVGILLPPWTIWWHIHSPPTLH